MDKRQEKTLNLIYSSFSKIIQEKNYEDITIQDIIDEAKISRSTFYSHFKTKDDLLISITMQIFEHVFSHSLQEEKSHDFSKDFFYDYKHLTTHIFYHIKDEYDLICGILKSTAKNIFLDKFREQLNLLISSYYSNYKDDNKLPLELKKKIIIENFIVILSYWVDNKCENYTPEGVSEFFIELM